MALSPQLRETLIIAYGVSPTTSQWIAHRGPAWNTAHAEFALQVVQELYDYTKFYFTAEERESFGPVLTAAHDHFDRMAASDGFMPEQKPDAAEE